MSLLGFVVLAPLTVLLALAVRLLLGSPILFRQQRSGLYGRPFWLLKFRTMTDERGPDGALLPDAVRLTRFGRWLRSTSLDELPELANVLKGEMSLVGPRPLLIKYLDRYTEEQFRRHDVLPGITGWAQINGRNSISWQRKFALDLWYVDHANLYLDLWILACTFWKVITRHGINHSSHDTMSEFEPGASRRRGCQ
jgi:sugar transferase EpsL